MRNRIYTLLLSVVVALVMPFATSVEAQTLNTFSTYSMYGLGELQSQGTLATRSLGGAGVAMRSVNTVNILNPASFSASLRKSVLFDYGMEGSSHFSTQKVDGKSVSGGYTTANFHNIALQIPLGKGVGMGFSVTPFSEVGYRQTSDLKDHTLGYVESENSGSGGISEMRLGVGWEILEGLSIGAAAQYYWGNIDRNFNSNITNMMVSGNVVSYSGVDNISVSSIKGMVGLQSVLVRNEKRVVVAGLTMDIGGDLKPRAVRTISGSNGTNGIYAQNDTTSRSIVLPRKMTAGVEYSGLKMQIFADLSYQGWTNGNDIVEQTSKGMSVSYNDFLMGRVGVQYTPRKNDVRHYLNRVQYRVGASYGGYEYAYAGRELTQYSITAGLGFPLKAIGISKIDVGVEWGGLGTTDSVQVSGERIGLVRENHLKFSLGFTMFGDDYWFVRPQID